MPVDSVRSVAGGGSINSIVANHARVPPPTPEQSTRRYEMWKGKNLAKQSIKRVAR